MSKHTQQQELPYKDVEKTLDAILYNIKYVKFHAYDDPYYNLRPIVVGKRMLSIDRTAQKILKKKLETIYSGNYK